MRRASLSLILMSLITAPPPALSRDSVILGRGISNHFLSKLPCPQPEDSNLTSICLDANSIWVLSARRTIAGPPVKGTVRAIFSQHVAATAQFVRSTELFVLRPIGDPALRKSSHADYYLVDLSIKDSDGRYCLSDKSEEVGLRLSDDDVVVSGEGQSCFNATWITDRYKFRGIGP